MIALLAPTGSRVAKWLLFSGVTDVLADNVSQLSFPVQTVFLVKVLYLTAERIQTGMRLTAPILSVLGGPFMADTIYVDMQLGWV